MLYKYHYSLYITVSNTASIIPKDHGYTSWLITPDPVLAVLGLYYMHIPYKLVEIVLNFKT